MKSGHTVRLSQRILDQRLFALLCSEFGLQFDLLSLLKGEFGLLLDLLGLFPQEGRLPIRHSDAAPCNEKREQGHESAPNGERRSLRFRAGEHPPNRSRKRCLVTGI